MNAQSFSKPIDDLRASPDQRARLSVRGVGKSFAGIQVLSGIDLEVYEGEVLAIVGENGAGKSTLSSIIAGLLLPDTGAMWWEGSPYAPDSPRDAMATGVGLIHQEMRLLPALSVAENVFVGRLPKRNGFVDRENMHKRAAEQLHRLGLDISPATPVHRLSVAAQQQVEIAKALTLDAKLLILDEPTAALGGPETDRLFSQIDRLKKQGVSFIYISHRLDEIARIADRIVVLRDGKSVARHASADIPVNIVLENMVGRSVDRIFPAKVAPGTKEVFRCEQLTATNGRFREVGFTVHSGEIVGIAGIVGAGRSELVRAIVGVDPLAAGEIWIEGERIQIREPGDAIRAGMVLVPEDRKAQGLVLDHSVASNLSLGNYDRIGSKGWLSPQGIGAFAKDAIQRLGVKGTPQQLARHLSGGNQQKVIIARWISRVPKIFILDEPTRGIDMGARSAIYETIAGLARGGMGVIVVSSDLEEVLGLSHRILVLSRGRQKGILNVGDTNQVAIMDLATS
jgi:ribose transport system ATP-binding protein